MKELLRTTNPTTPPFVQATLNAAGIESLVFDEHMASLMGGLPFAPRRIMVADEDLAAARTALWPHRDLLPELPGQTDGAG